MWSTVVQLVENQTGDGRVASSSLTASRVTVLCPWVKLRKTAMIRKQYNQVPHLTQVKTLYLLLISTGSIHETPARHDWKIVDWNVTNQNKQNQNHLKKDDQKFHRNEGSLCKHQSIRLLTMLWSFEGCIWINNFTELRPISIICLMRGLSLEGIVVIWLLSLLAKQPALFSPARWMQNKKKGQ